MLLMIPGPTDIHERVRRAMGKPLIDHRGPEFRELLERVTQRAKKIFGTENDLFLLTCSSTGGIECATSNLVMRGDNVLVPSYGVFCERMAESIGACGASVETIQIPYGEAVTRDQVVRALENNDKTDSVAMVYNETSTGVRVSDLSEISEICREKGKILLVDAVSILAGAKLPVDELGIDVCVAGTQKCLAGPPGLSLISVSERSWRVINRERKRLHYFDLELYRKFFAERRETPFTPALSLVYGLDEALSIVFEAGLETWIDRHTVGAEALYAALESMGLELFAKPQFRSPTVLSIKVPRGVSETDLRSGMREKHGVAIGGGMGSMRGKILRIGNMGLVSRRRIEVTIGALGVSLASQGFRTDYEGAIELAIGILERKGFKELSI